MANGKLVITLRSGAQVTADVDADEVEWTRGNASGKLTALTWIAPEGAADQLCYIDLDEVAAVAVIHERLTAEAGEEG